MADGAIAATGETGTAGNHLSVRPPVYALLSAGAGATLMYFLDPDRGHARWARLRDRTAGSARHLGHHAARFGRHAASSLYGVRQKMTHPHPVDDATPNDPDLVQRVETALFRDARIPKGAININAEQGKIVLRGQIGDPGMVRAIERKVGKVHGVREVENLMHLPGTPAPNKLAALRAWGMSIISQPQRAPMVAEEQPVIPVDPEAAGSEDPEAPGEPDRAHQIPSTPVPRTGRKRKAEHMRAHEEAGNEGIVEKRHRHEHEYIAHS